MTKTEKWEQYRVQHGLRGDEGRSLFGSTPPIRSVRTYRYIVPRVLVIGTNAEVGSIATSNPLCECSHSRQIYEIALKHGLEKLRVQYASRIVFFWEQFFDEKDYIGHAQQRSLPALIITTGLMRNYPDMGGETLGVKNRLEQIASRWGIPIEFIPSTAI